MSDLSDGLFIVQCDDGSATSLIRNDIQPEQVNLYIDLRIDDDITYLEDMTFINDDDITEGASSGSESSDDDDSIGSQSSDEGDDV